MKQSIIKTVLVMCLFTIMMVIGYWVLINAPFVGIDIGDKWKQWRSAGADSLESAPNMPHKHSPPMLYYQVQFTEPYTVLYTNSSL